MRKFTIAISFFILTTTFPAFGQVELQDNGDILSSGNLRLAQFGTFEGSILGLDVLQGKNDLRMQVEGVPYFNLTLYDGQSIFDSDSNFGTNVDINNSDGGKTWRLVSTGSLNSEGAGYFIIDEVNVAPRMTFQPGGNIGIGTATPSSKLNVKDGNIEVTNGSFIDDGMTLTVPDFVFKEEYDLKSLTEIEQFINENDHLEGVPSMHDTKGWAALSMQQRDMLLLQKVEELTLHMITMDKELKNQIALNRDLQKEIQGLQKKRRDKKSK